MCGNDKCCPFLDIHVFINAMTFDIVTTNNFKTYTAKPVLCDLPREHLTRVTSQTCLM